MKEWNEILAECAAMLAWRFHLHNGHCMDYVFSASECSSCWPLHIVADTLRVRFHNG